MLICTLISVFRQASALEREGAGLGTGTGEGGEGGAGWRGPCKGPVAPPNKGRQERSQPAVGDWKAMKLSRSSPPSRHMGTRGPQSHVGSPAKEGRLWSLRPDRVPVLTDNRVRVLGQ